MSPAHKLTRLHARLLALALAAGLGLSACGGGDDSSSSSTASTTSSTSTAASDLRQKFDNLLQQNLTGNQGLSGDIANCVVKNLQQNVTDEQIQQVIDSGQLTPAVTKAAQSAGITCAQQSQGG
jgi:hypothetical protein